jgi:hypothetical protein
MVHSKTWGGAVINSLVRKQHTVQDNHTCSDIHTVSASILHLLQGDIAGVIRTLSLSY